MRQEWSKCVGTEARHLDGKGLQLTNVEIPNDSGMSNDEARMTKEIRISKETPMTKMAPRVDGFD